MACPGMAPGHTPLTVSYIWPLQGQPWASGLPAVHNSGQVCLGHSSGMGQVGNQHRVENSCQTYMPMRLAWLSVFTYPRQGTMYYVLFQHFGI